MPDMTGQPIHALKAAAVAFLAKELPHLLPDVIEVQLVSLTRGKRLATVFIPRDDTCRPPAGSPAPPPGRLLQPCEHTSAPAPRFNDMEQDVLDALTEAGGEELTGEQIAERAGHPFESPLRRCLASLRRRGVLTGEPGERGYRLANPTPPTVP